MMEEMYSTMQRISEIRERFKLEKPKTEIPAETKPAVSFEQHVNAASISGGAASDTAPHTSAQSRVRGNMSVDAINALAEREAKSAGISPALVKAVIQNESGYDADAVSPKGAMGLMQLMPKTAESLGVADPFSPEDNIRGGVKMMKDLLAAYKGDYQKAVAAYNAGKGAVDRNNGIPPYAETQDYVKKVIDTVRSSDTEE